MASRASRQTLSDNPRADLRYRRTLAFLRDVLPPPASVLDLGTPNPFSAIMTSEGYQIRNTPEGVDLDFEPDYASAEDVDAVTAFEILEHLVSPFSVLRAVRAPRLIATVPLRLWFDSAYRNPDDPWDNHFHEFEDWQFEWLLRKAGWEIEKAEKWNGPGFRFGVRPLLRLITPRYFAVAARRKAI